MLASPFENEILRFWFFLRFCSHQLYMFMDIFFQSREMGVNHGQLDASIEGGCEIQL